MDAPALELVTIAFNEEKAFRCVGPTPAIVANFASVPHDPAGERERLLTKVN